VAVSFTLIEPQDASVAQSVEQLIRNQQVGGSIPLAGSIDSTLLHQEYQRVARSS
jgi:hypothetical protein